MKFCEVHGQEAVKRRLISSVKENRVSHAQLFSGPCGVGKLALAIAYAQYVCCENRGEDDSCGVCPSCRKFAKLAHPDLHFFFPVKSASSSVAEYMPAWREFVSANQYIDKDMWFAAMNKGDKEEKQNAEGIIGVKEADEMLRIVTTKAYEAEYKVIIVWLSECMNVGCSNKILKILEEPQGNTLFLMITENVEKMLTTIISRTQNIFVPPIEANAMQSAIEKKYGGVPADKLPYIIKVSGGSFIKAVKLLDKEEGDEDIFFEIFVDVMRSAYKSAVVHLKEISEKVCEYSKKNQISFLEYFQRMIRENFIYNLKVSELNYMTESECGFSSKFSPFVNERNVADFMSEIELAQRHLEQNVNSKIVFFDLFLKFGVMLKK